MFIVLVDEMKRGIMVKLDRHYKFVLPESQFLEKPTRPSWSFLPICFTIELDFDLEVKPTLCLTGQDVGLGTWKLLSIKQRQIAVAILDVPGVRMVELGMLWQLKFHISPRCDRTLIYPGIMAALYAVYGAIEIEAIAA